MYKDTKLDVPFFSQYLDIKSKQNCLRGCGIACAFMALRYFGSEIPSLDKCVEQGLQQGGYSKSGWSHDYLVRLFREFGYTCNRREKMSDREFCILVDALRSENPVIVSVVRRMWDRRDFHMVVLTGIRENDDYGVRKLDGFFYHDPASLRREESNHLYVPLSTFLLDWRRMAIIPNRSAPKVNFSFPPFPDCQKGHRPSNSL